MGDKRWMIYGAYGYTGQLIVEEALRRGHRPLLAGRSEEKLRQLSEKTGLPYVAVDLRDSPKLIDSVSGVSLVFHAAGPFVYTASSMIRACIQAGTHYLDVTGEIPVFEHTLAQNKKAAAKGIVLVSGAGFDVIPTDCLAAQVSTLVENPDFLEVAFGGLGGVSPGTVRTFIRGLDAGILVRRNGRLTGLRGARRSHIHLNNREYAVKPISWGDLSTAYHTTGIPNINVYCAFHNSSFLFSPGTTMLLSYLHRFSLVRKIIQKWIDNYVHGPSEKTRQTSRSFVWARASNERGQSAQRSLELPESYKFTAVAGVRCVERVLSGMKGGAFTPSQAFGDDFVEQIEGTSCFAHSGVVSAMQEG